MAALNYTQFFKDVAGKGKFEPYDYQQRLAGRDSGKDCESLLIDIPTGLGKTAAVTMAWLWNRVILNRSDWPRRLVYCLPMRTLVEQTRDNVKDWLAAAVEKYPDNDELKWLHKNSPVILMGGEKSEKDQVDWDLHPERCAILIGTQDMLLSRALNRGYGMSRYRWPMHFGLLNNDCLWVMDEVQLMGAGLPTTAQLAAFRAHLGCGSPTHSWWMSAPSDLGWLRTVDFDPESLSNATIKLIETDLNAKPVKKIREATKTVSRFPKTKDATALAGEILKEIKSRDGLTLIVVNTVKQARTLFGEITKQ